MQHRDELLTGLHQVEARLKALQDEDAALTDREAKLRIDLVAAPGTDADALAAVRSGAALARKGAPRAVDTVQHELDTILAARRALAAEIEAAQREIGSLRRTLDRLAVRDIGGRAIANGGRIDQLLAALDGALAERELIYAAAIEGGLAFRLGVQPALLDHLIGAWNVSSALSHRLREVARSPSADIRKSIEAADRQFFAPFAD